MGNIIRSCVLLVLALLTWWKFGVVAAAVMLLSAVVLGILAALGRYGEQEQ